MASFLMHGVDSDWLVHWFVFDGCHTDTTIDLRDYLIKIRLLRAGVEISLLHDHLTADLPREDEESLVADALPDECPARAGGVVFKLRLIDGQTSKLSVEVSQSMSHLLQCLEKKCG